jgi:hypothetical protein
VIPSTPPDFILVAEDIDIHFLDIDIGIDCYVSLVRHMLNGHEFEQDIQG